jgi:hypothetical protein
VRRHVFLFFLALILASRLAHADGSELLLLSKDKALVHAVASALRPYGIEVRPSEDEPPVASMPAAASEARTLAARNGAHRVAWIATSDDGPSLWIYDPVTDHAVTRPLSRTPPYDEATAASVALSVKTLLRSLDEVSTAVTTQTTATPEIHERAVERVAPPPPRPVARDARVVTAIGGVARIRETNAEPLEPRLAMWLGVRLASWFAIGTTASFGPGVASNESTTALRLVDTTVGVWARATVGTGALRLGAVLPFDVHIERLTGVALGIPVASSHVNASFGVGAFGSVVLAPHLALTLWFVTHIEALHQEFFIHDVPALAESSVFVDAGLFIGRDF